MDGEDRRFQRRRTPHEEEVGCVETTRQLPDQEDGDGVPTHPGPICLGEKDLFHSLCPSPFRGRPGSTPDDTSGPVFREKGDFIR